MVVKMINNNLNKTENESSRRIEMALCREEVRFNKKIDTRSDKLCKGSYQFYTIFLWTAAI
jgi:hypothetical protein